MVNHYLTPGAIIDSNNTWNGDIQTFSNGLTIGLAASAPAPDNDTVHIWAGTADSLTSGGILTIENNGNALIDILTTDDGAAGLRVKRPTEAGVSDGIVWDIDVGNTMSLFVGSSTARLRYSANAFAFQEATTISTTGGALTLDPTTIVVIPTGKELVQGATAEITTNNEWDAGSVIPGIQVLGAVKPALVIGSWTTTAVRGPTLILLRSHNATIGNNTLVVDGDSLGGISWAVADGNDFRSIGATIRAVVSGTAAENDIPTTLQFLVNSGDRNPGEKWRMTDVGCLTSLAAAPANAATTDGGIIATGGIAFTDVANAWIDDATHGSGTVTHYIGDETIDTTSSYRAAKENIVPVNGSGRRHLEALSGLLSEYDYRSGTGHFVGLIAEDVQKVMPQYVIGADAPSLRYQYMVGPLLWGWGDHDARIAVLEAQVAALSGI